METLREYPRQLAAAALGLLLALLFAELATRVLAAVPTVWAPAFPPDIAVPALYVSAPLLIFYAAPLLLVLQNVGKSAYVVAAVAGGLPGVTVGLLAGPLAIYGSLLGVMTGVLSVAIQRLLHWHGASSGRHRQSEA